MRNHYVPQFLLRSWASPQDRALQVYHISNTGIHLTRKAPKRTGYEEDMLSLTRDEVAGIKKHDIETVVLSKVDNDAAVVHKRLCNGQIKSLSHNERCSWARFIMSLRIRNPSIVHYLIEDADMRLRKSLSENLEEYEQIISDEELPSLEEWTEQRFPGLIENFGLSFFPDLLNDQKIGNYLLRLRWWVCDVSEAKNTLLLGDHPCIFFGSIESANLAVALPITPNRLFVATRGEILANGLPHIKPTSLVARVNDATVRQAKQYVYDRNATSLRFVQNRHRR